MRTLARTTSRLSYAAKTRIAAVPTLAVPLARVRGRGEAVGRETDIVIESFPRCASSFAVAAFRLAQEPRATRIANHTHMPAQVLWAVRRGIPAIVLIRDPEGAVLSHAIHSPALSVEDSLRGFVRFYEPLLAVRDRIIVGTFEEVTREFGAVVDRVNERYGTSFERFEPTAANLERIRAEIETDYRSRARSRDELDRIIPAPREGRAALRDRMRPAYAAASPSLRRRAETLYEALLP